MASKVRPQSYAAQARSTSRISRCGRPGRGRPSHSPRKRCPAPAVQTATATRRR